MTWGPKRKETIPTRRLIAEIPEPLFKALKMRAAAEEALIKDLVAEALRCFLKLREAVTARGSPAGGSRGGAGLDPHQL